MYRNKQIAGRQCMGSSITKAAGAGTEAGTDAGQEQAATAAHKGDSGDICGVNDARLGHTER